METNPKSNWLSLHMNIRKGVYSPEEDVNVVCHLPADYISLAEIKERQWVTL